MRENGFNRYMVECEYVDFMNSDACKIVLIDTWWNVNEWWCYRYFVKNRVLIDTWWNVNCEYIILTSLI